MRLLTVLLAASLVLGACAGVETATTTTTTTAAAVPATTQAPATTEATTTTAAPTTTTTSTEAPAPSGQWQYEIADGSAVRFTIDEELRGSPATVVAVNTSVSGAFIVDTEGPTLVDGGQVVVRAADFVTDSDLRNGAIDRFILEVTAHPEIVFDITSATPTEASGTLTIREISNDVTFETTLAGDALAYTYAGTAVVDRTLWDLNIPSVPFVANVSEEVTLEFELVLEPAG
ncbi:MAG: YceI family protein [Acidimicrobiia bacterium]|nr:MAG: YceI family protein [Acidimicrobiia bacterium]